MRHVPLFKRCLSLLLVWGILCSLTVFPSAQATTRASSPGEYFYSQLSPANQEAYDAIKEQVEKLASDDTDPSAVSFTPTTGSEPTGAAIFAFFRDHPEYFWVNSSKLAWSVSSDQVWSLSTVVSGESFFYEGFDVASLPTVRQEFAAQVEEIISAMPSGGDTVAQLRYLNNWIALHNVYNPLGVGASNYSRSAASGILSNNSTDTAPVCYGYATAFKVLLDAAGIPNAYIEGWAYNQNNWPSGEQHAWNYVQVDGVWYAIDPTWDDPKLTTGQARFHYFLVGSSTVTETSLTGKETFGQNHDPSKSPANSYSLSYPTLSTTASSAVVTTGFELIQGETSQKFDTLEAALTAAEYGATVKLWQTATIDQTLTIPDGVTLDLNGQKDPNGSSLNATAISGTISPLLTIEAGSSASIVNSSSFTAINTTSTGVCIQNNGTLELGANIKISCTKNYTNPSSISSPIGGNAPGYASNSYAALNPSSPNLLFVYLVIQPTVSSAPGSYQATGQETVNDLIQWMGTNTPTLNEIQYYGPTGATLPVPSSSIAPYTWSVGRSPNDGNHIAPEAPLENGEYLFVTTVFGYPVTYTVTVSGVPDPPKTYTVTVNGGESATGSGTYEEGATVTVTAGTKEGYIFQSWTAEGITLFDATQSTISFTMPGNHVTLTANFVRDYTIGIAGATLEPKTYDGSAAATVASVDFDGLLGNEQLLMGTDYTATATFDTPNAGTGKTVTVTVTLLDNNYTFSDGAKIATYQLTNQTIDKASYTGVTAVTGLVRANTSGQVELPQPPNGATFGTPVSTAGGQAITQLNISGNTLSYEGGSGILAGQTYTVTIPVNGGNNYNDYQITVTLTGSGKQVLTITGVTAQNGVYNGTTHTGYTGTPVATGYDGAFTISYNTPDHKAPTDAGTYTVTFAIPEDNSQFSGSVTLTFTIAQKPLTVSVPSLSVYVGDSVPTLALVYTGLVSGETVTPSEQPVFAILTADGTQVSLADAMKTAGTYTIVWSNADSTTFPDAHNYQVIRDDSGVLTVAKRPGTDVEPTQPPVVTPTPTPEVTPKPETTPTPAPTKQPDTGARPEATPQPAPAPVTTPAPNPTPTPITTPGPTVTTNQVEATLEDSTAVATVGADQLEQIITQAVEEARNSGGMPAVKLEVVGAEGAQALQVTLHQTALAALVQEAGATLTISSSVAQVTFDYEAMKAILQQANGEIVLMVTPVPKDKLNQAQASAVGEFPVVELTLQSGGVVIAGFQTGNATITMPYTLAQGQQADGIVVWYLDEEGKTTACQTSYDEASGKVTFVTPHFSKYVVGYDPTLLPDQPQVSTTQQPQPADTPQQDNTLPVLPILGGVILVLVLAVGIVLWRRSRGRAEV